MTATPPYIWIGTLPHHQYRLRKAIRLKVDREGGYVLVWSGMLLVHGVGDHMTQAIEDFQMFLCALYDDLIEYSDGRLGPGMVRLKATYDRVIVVRA